MTDVANLPSLEREAMKCSQLGQSAQLGALPHRASDVRLMRTDDYKLIATGGAKLSDVDACWGHHCVVVRGEVPNSVKHGSTIEKVAKHG
jgi:hypothetical protein